MSMGTARHRRADPEDEQAPSETRREGPIPTPREGGPHPTRREAEATTTAVSLPPDLAERFPGADLLPAHGAEADVFRVPGPAGEDRALKLYRRGVAPDARVTALLTDIRHPHVVRTYEAGTSSTGARWELMEYLPHGSLRTLLEGGAPASTMGVVVRQVTSGLLQLHDREIVHRDLKPENVLVRSLDPLELVLTDFGLSRAVEQGKLYSTQARSSFYAAPESFQGLVGESRDWWSLGIVVREFSGRTPLFDGLDERQILHTIQFRPIDTTAIDDPRLQLLARGLLVKEPSARWSSAEVASWLDGGTPKVARETGGTGPAPSFPFLGRTYDDPADLAEAMASHWREAARLFVTFSNAARDDLFSWGSACGLDTAEKHRLLQEMDHARPDVQLLLILTWLDPELPAVHLGRPLDVDALRDLTVRATQGGAGEQAVLDDLLRGDALDIVSRMPGGAGLGDAQRRWFDGIAEWDHLVRAESAALTHVGGALLDEASRRRAVADLLLAALGTLEQSLAALSGRLAAGRQELVRPVPWFDDLASRARTVPATLVALGALPAAISQAEQEVAAEQAAYAEAIARRTQWDDRETTRAAGRNTAIGHAVAGALIPTVASGLIAANGILGVLSVVLCAAITFAAEVGVARTLGGDYHPGYSLLTWFGLRAKLLGHALKREPGATVAIWGLAGMVLLGIGVGFPPVLPVIVTTVVCVSAWKRYRSWQGWYDEAHRSVVGWQP